MFRVSWQSHFDSSVSLVGSSDECRAAPGGRRPSDQANRLGLWVRLWAARPTSTIAIYYYSVQKLIFILPSHGVWKAAST